MSTDLLPVDPPAVVPADPSTSRPKKCVCEFCGCTLAPSGDVLAMSDQAREYRDLNDRLRTTQSELQTVSADVERLTRELNDARASLAATQKPAVRW